MATGPKSAATTRSVDDLGRAIYWTLVPIFALDSARTMAMAIAVKLRIMGRLTLPMPMVVGGRLATIVIAVATIGFFVI